MKHHDVRLRVLEATPSGFAKLTERDAAGDDRDGRRHPERLAIHLHGSGSPLIRAAVAAGVSVHVAATLPVSRFLERRLKRWHNTGHGADGRGDPAGWECDVNAVDD